MHSTPPLLPDGDPNVAMVNGFFAGLGERLDSMITLQMAAYPSGWTDEERREMAERHLFTAPTPSKSGTGIWL